MNVEPTPALSLELGIDESPTAPKLRLRRYVPGAACTRSVVLFHGGNTLSDIYLHPCGGLTLYLTERGWDVWLADWRGSPYVTKQVLGGSPLGGTVAEEWQHYTLDDVIDTDIPILLKAVRHHIGDGQLNIIAWCFSAGAVSTSIARGRLEPFNVSHVVLMALGLFYEVPWNGWIKAEDYILERVIHNAPMCRAISPASTNDWPVDFKSAYDKWPSAWLPPGERPIDAFLSRLTFMVGQPMALENLDDRISDEIIFDCIGPMHLGLYLHAGQMVRRGYSSRFDAPDFIDRERLAEEPPATTAITDDFCPRPFQGMTVTLIIASEDRVWYRDSADMMYEWLRNNGHPNSTKHVVDGYMLLELLWGKHARVDVYERISNGLAPFT